MKDHYTLSNIKKIPWGVLEENHPISLYPIMYPGWCNIVDKTGYITGLQQKNASCLHFKSKGIIFINHKEWTAIGQHLLKKIVSHPAWGNKVNNDILSYSDKLVHFTRTNITQVNLKKKTNQQLFQLYKNYLTKHSQLYNCSIVPVYLDLYKPHLTTYLTDYLAKRVKATDYHKTAKECFAKLTVPDKISRAQQEEHSLLKIADNINIHLGKSKFERKHLSNKMILTTEKHISQYRHLGYNFEGPAFPDKYFWNRLRSMVTDKTKPVDKLLSFSLERRQIKFIHNKILKALKIDKKHDQLFTLTQGFIYSKDFRKMSLVQSYYEVEPLLKEISRRTKLKLPEIRNCLLDEIQQMLAGKLTRPKDLNKRMQGCYFVVINRQLPGRVYVNRIFQEMKKYLLKKEDLTEVNYFHGQTACLGQAKGIVRIINSVKDLKKMKQGNIMVSQMTNPDLVPAMKKASAIITDLGGITCHASIVSRELNIPCVIGTKMATQILKDGDKVQVDANRGDVNRIK